MELIKNIFKRCGVLLSFLFMGCSTPSILIKPNDDSFNYGIERLKRTIVLLDKIKPPSEEKMFFVQGESFYLYRFEPPKKSKMSFMAEVAASITDFPALQALSGSLSLLDLRLRSSDSAIQIWETLLERYPNTTLRPLTLYRLGWAYHNASALGFPRKDPNQAFDDLLKEAPGTTLAELSMEAKEVPWKSKSSAAKRSLLPGLGQLYVGETKNGIIRLSIAVVSAAAIIAPIIIASKRGSNLSWKHDWPLLVSGVGGLIVLSFDYTSSYEDAMRGVVQWNENSERKFNSEHPNAP